MTDIDALLAAEGWRLESAKGPIPNIAQLVAGEPIAGSWWAHPASQEIFDVINRLAASPYVARLRLVDHRVTLVHRRLWPALLRLAPRYDDDACSSSARSTPPPAPTAPRRTPLRDWVPADVRAAAAVLTDDEATALLPLVLRPPAADTAAP